MFDRVMNNKYIKPFFSFQNEIKRLHISAYASSAAFFTFLSLIPMLLVFFSILPFTPVTKATLMKIIKELFPESAIAYAISIVNEMYNKTGAYLSFTILFTLWSAGKGTLALIRALNTLNEVEDQRNYVILRIKACIYTLIMLLSILLLLVMVVFGEKIMKWITVPLPHLIYFFDTIIHIRVVVILALLTFFLCMVYTWLPENRYKSNAVKKNGKPIYEKRKRSLRKEFPGAFLCALAWYFSSWLFSEYINRFSAFSTYGSLTTVVIIMFWLYLCFYIILLGGIFNQHIEQINKYLKRIVFKMKDLLKV